MRVNEIVTEAPAGVGYRGMVASINQRHAAKKAAINYSDPAVKKKLAAQNYGKWIKYVKARRSKIDMADPKVYRAELLKVFSDGGQIDLGNDFKARVAASKLSTRDVKGLVALAIDVRAAAKARLAPAAEPTAAAPKATPQAAPEPTAAAPKATPQAAPEPTAAEPEPAPAPAAEPTAAEPEPAPQATPEPEPAPATPEPEPAPATPPRAKPAANARPNTVKVAGEPWKWDGEKWRNPKGAAAGAGMAAAIEAFIEEQNK